MPENIAIAVIVSSLTAFISVAIACRRVLRVERRKRLLRVLGHQQEAVRGWGQTGSRSRKRKRYWTPIKAIALLGQYIQRIRLVGNGQSEKIRMSLVQAGYRSREAVIIYLALKLLLPIIGAVLALTIILSSERLGGSLLLSFVGVVGSALLFSYLPDLILKKITEARRNKLRKGLPDALDLLVVCAEAGLGLDSALKKAAEDFVKTNPVTADELALLNAELVFYQNREEALSNFSKRINIPLATSVVLALTQAERYGTPLSKALRTLAAEFRRERLTAAEQKAGRLPVIMTVPLVGFILPALFIVILGPAILSALNLMP